MKRIALSMFIAVALSASATAGEWVDLFNGKNLNGWIQKNGTATYRIEGDAITGKTNEGSPNSFLCTKKLYGDFELEFEIEYVAQGNSGSFDIYVGGVNSTASRAFYIQTANSTIQKGKWKKNA